MRARLGLILLLVLGGWLAPPAARAMQPPAPDVTITASNPTTARVLQLLTTTITVKNIGTSAAANVVGTVHVPASQNGTVSVYNGTGGAVPGLGADNTATASVASLAGGASFTMDVTFSVVRAGTFPFVVDVSSTSAEPGGNDSVTQSLTFTGLTWTSAPVFGDTAVGSLSGAQHVTVTNGTAEVMNTTGVATTGTGGDDFMIPANTNTCGPTLAIDASCSFAVRFAPSAVGARAATLAYPTQYSFAPYIDASLSVPITANGIASPVNTGPTGPVGLAGPAGADGAAGRDGAPGAAGHDAASVARLVLAPVTTKLKARIGAKVKIGFADTVAGPVRLDVIKGGKTVATVLASAVAGPNTVVWLSKLPGKKKPPTGKYTLRLSAAAGGQTATTQAALTLTR